MSEAGIQDVERAITLKRAGRIMEIVNRTVPPISNYKRNASEDVIYLGF